MRDMVRIRGGAPQQRYRAPSVRLGRSQFDRSFNHKTTFDVGNMIPYFFDEVLPGDTITVRLNSFIRIFSPLESPIMDNIECSIDFFFVPMRLVWDNWEFFLGAHDAAGAQDTTYTIPKIDTGGVIAHGHLGHYFGLPIGLDTAQVDVSCLPFRGWRLIYNEWYRDQNLIDQLAIPTDDGPDTPAECGLGTAGVFTTAKKHDYFTSALPYLQKGTASAAALAGIVQVASNAAIGDEITVLQAGAQRQLEADAVTRQIEQTGTVGIAGDDLFVDLSSAGTVDINALREAAAIQRLLERDARGGTRYTEQIFAHFGVEVPDYRVQRPEYLGGGKGFVHVSPIGNTSSTATEDQGELRGIGTGTLSASFAQSFVEHGYVYGVLRARGEVSYSQGLDRMWSRQDRYDFYWPELSQLGEQSILNKEIFVSNSSATDDAVFGYQERNADYRFKKSLITGKFAPDVPSAIDHWHLSEDFAALPSLNQTFIEDATPMSRVQTVTTEPDLIIDGRFNYRCARPMPVRPTPTLAPARF